MSDMAFRADSTFRKHIRLTFQLAVLIDILQGTEQVIGRIIRKCLGIAAGIDQAVLRSKLIIERVQFLLFCVNIFLRIVLHLVINQLIYRLAKLHQSPYPSFGRFV